MSVVIEIIIFCFTVSLALINTSTWMRGFFYATMASVALLNIASAVYQNCLYGLAAAFPMQYSGAIILGTNTSGTLVSLINIIAIALSPNPKAAAVFYFSTALLILVFCFDSYFCLPLTVSCL